MTSSRPNWKRGWRHGVGSVMVAVIALVVTSGWFAIETATAEPISDEISFVSRINDARTAIGLRALTSMPELGDQARSWSVRLRVASNEKLGRDCQLSHNQEIASEVHLNWTKLGENVGCSTGDVDVVHRALMNSPEHRRNILDPTFDSIGVGVVMADSTMFVTEVFMQTSAWTKRTSRLSTKIIGSARHGQLIPAKRLATHRFLSHRSTPGL